MSKFADLDVMIVTRIARAPCTFAELQEPGLNEAAGSFVVADRHGVPGPIWRVLNRRLQALRKEGHIVYSKGRWWIKGTEALV
ncbi:MULTISPECIES: hypothetical protein [unclassified Variovorax]|uniref:hypothetical protein n=1 Tax=unclassified Variovorax TaxID=663243 RepID=UPI00257633F3|nr:MULTISPECIES: hypothetical protein [unclassified Variovorax]MDM0090280.1 hypothetical protein [Variovorax sp. J22G40]MDM0148054.1 hypothetical protein [Variovorax sp. J2P1-31]